MRWSLTAVSIVGALLLPRQHRHVVPGIVRGLIAPEPAAVLTHDVAVLLDDDAIGVGVHILY
jgi:hypothetical protein